MDINDYILMFKKYTKGDLKEEEISSLNTYILNILGKMKNETISYDEQNLLDNYVDFLRDNLLDRGIVSTYDDIINKRYDMSLKEESNSRDIGKRKVLSLFNDNKGIITIVTIFEGVFALAMLIVSVLLALKNN